VGIIGCWLLVEGNLFNILAEFDPAASDPNNNGLVLAA
jgi:hypothetical protein